MDPFLLRDGQQLCVDAKREPRWYGLTRGSASGLAGATPFRSRRTWWRWNCRIRPLPHSLVHQLRTGDGADRWKALSYADLFAMRSTAASRCMSPLGDQYRHVPDLERFQGRRRQAAGHTTDLADVLVPPQGTINTLNRVAAQMGGMSAIQSFYRFYLVPGMSHGFSNGTTNAAPTRRCRRGTSCMLH
jgi:feruloyl esterase